MSVKTRNIIISGVGGQGNIAASKVIGEAALKAGFDVKITETHGMAQRGGAVHSMIRFGEVVYSPLIPQGLCDVLISLEYAEGIRWLHYLSDEPVILVSTEKRKPAAIVTGEAAYPEDAEKLYCERGRLLLIPALEIAREAGSVRAANVVMIGAYLAAEREIPFEFFVEAIEERFAKKPALVEINKIALINGKKYAENLINMRR